MHRMTKARKNRLSEQSVLAQLVKSLSRQEADELHVPSNALKRFRYLNRSGCTTIAGTDDVADFCLVKHAMDAVNIDKKSQVLLL
jgi:myosin heavy subunit